MTLRATISMCLPLVLTAGFAVHVNAADLPAIKTTDRNKVAECASPGRLMAFLKSRNDKLDAKFDTIAVDYMKHGEELQIRWDIAFFQMLLETGDLKFGGDVKPAQNNFAGLGATGNGERGESFKDVTTGVRAHLEHVLMYTGTPVANPVAERTRKVQEWRVLSDWQKSIKGPMTFTQLARKWAPPARKYAQDIEEVASSFTSGPCTEKDPRPELVALARTGKTADKPAAIAAATPAADPAKPSGAELAKRAVDEARADGTGKRAALGAGGLAKGPATEVKTVEASAPEPGPADAKQAESKPAVPKSGAGKPQNFALLNPPKPEANAPAEKPAAGATGKSTKGAAAPAGCKVFTASYGGAKAIIIKAVAGESVNYTVLDVNEGAESREAEAYIAAYARGGKQVGEFKSQASALDKAFELCPEG